MITFRGTAKAATENTMNNDDEQRSQSTVSSTQSREIESTIAIRLEEPVMLVTGVIRARLRIL